ncbi:metal ABC transporter substrate-binding protein [Pseudotamlana haliotis]|nr:metal ABC transporter substrate-binding protein [Tamlana haliotis]
MKKISLLVLCLFSLMACKNDKKTSETEQAMITSKKPVVYVSNYPLYYFAERIGGNDVDLRFPMQDSKSIANWQPQSDTVVNMQAADVVFINGASYEKWLTSISLPESILVNTTKNVEEDLLDSGHVFTHSHGEGGAHEHKEMASTTWLDLALANKQAEAMATYLLSKFPEKKAVFKANFDKLSEDLLELDSKFKAVANKKPNLSVVFSHPVYQYFEDAYEINGRSLHWEPDYQLNHKNAHEIKHLVADKKFNYLIWEGEPLEETRAKLEKMNIESIVVNPIYSVPENSNYFKEMENNLKQLQLIYEE